MILRKLRACVLFHQIFYSSDSCESGHLTHLDVRSKPPVYLQSPNFFPNSQQQILISLSFCTKWPNGLEFDPHHPYWRLPKGSAVVRRGCPHVHMRNYKSVLRGLDTLVREYYIHLYLCMFVLHMYVCICVCIYIIYVQACMCMYICCVCVIYKYTHTHIRWR